MNSLHSELVFLLLSVTFTSLDTTLSMTKLTTSSTQHNVMLKILSYCYAEYNLSERHFYCYAECHLAECHYFDCRNAKCCGARVTNHDHLPSIILDLGYESCCVLQKRAKKCFTY
jgi:hypothetical protein